MAVPLVNVLGIVLVALAGVGQALQSGMNSQLGTHTGKAFAGVVSFSVGLLAMALYFFVDVYAVGARPPTMTTLRGAPGWSWAGGVPGAFYVCCAIIFAPTLGAGMLTSISMSSQLLAAIVFDAWGLVGFPKRRLHWARLLGACLLVAGVVLMTVFRGELVDDGPSLPVHDTSSKGLVNGESGKSFDHGVMELNVTALAAADADGLLPAVRSPTRVAGP